MAVNDLLKAFYVETCGGCIAAVKAVDMDGVRAVLPEGIKTTVIRTLQVEDLRFCTRFL
jgi:hypothetical protein